MAMLELVQEELTGYPTGTQWSCHGRTILMPRFVGRATKRLEKRVSETFTTCL